MGHIDTKITMWYRYDNIPDDVLEKLKKEVEDNIIECDADVQNFLEVENIEYSGDYLFDTVDTEFSKKENNNADVIEIKLEKRGFNAIHNSTPKQV